MGDPREKHCRGGPAIQPNHGSSGLSTVRRRGQCRGGRGEKQKEEESRAGKRNEGRWPSR